MKERITEMFTGEFTMTKREFWLIVAVCTLFGVVIGFIKAPLSHGIMIGSGNWSKNSATGQSEVKENEKEMKECCHKAEKRKKEGSRL